MKYKIIDLFCGAGGMTLGFVDPRDGEEVPHPSRRVRTC
jgi:site-specific DNA-cytosine methylase